MLVLAGRAEPALPLARLRADGNLLELGTDELALSRRESLLLVRAAGVELGDDEAADLAARSEGWAAGLHLATLALRASGPLRGDRRIGGDDRFLAEYFRSEHLSRLSAEQQAFLRRTSVLERLSGRALRRDPRARATRRSSSPRSSARAGSSSSRSTGTAAATATTDLFRELLRHELELHEPALVPGLHRRAADWLEQHGDPEGALVMRWPPATASARRGS